MSQPDLVRQQLAEKEKALFDAETRIGELEAEVRKGKTTQQKLESEVTRLKKALESTEERLQKSKASEKKAMSDLQVSRTKSAALLKKVESGTFQQQPKEEPPTPPPAAPVAAPPPATDGEAAVELDRLRTTLNKERLATNLWKHTAAVVLDSYKKRLEITEEEKIDFDAIMRYRHSDANERVTSVEDRLAQLQQKLSLSTKLAGAEEEKRIEQFGEITSLRERVLVVEREKAVLDREMTSLDRTVAELESQVRGLERDKRHLEQNLTDTKEKTEQMSKLVGSFSAGPAPGPTGIPAKRGSSHHADPAALPPSHDLRAELAALREDMVAANDEKQVAQLMLKESEDSLRLAEDRLRTLHSRSVSPQQQQQRVGRRGTNDSYVGSASPGTPYGSVAPNAGQDVDGQMRALSQRMKQLEGLVQHKNEALEMAQLRINRYENGQRLAESAGMNYGGGLTYSQGMPRDTRSPKRQSMIGGSSTTPLQRTPSSGPFRKTLNAPLRR